MSHIEFDINDFHGVEKWYLGGCGFFEQHKNSQANIIIEELRAKYEFIGLGRNRMVFKLKSGNYVLKFSLSFNGEADNDWEGCLVTNKNKIFSEERVRTPKTKWIKYQGFVCVLMEYIKPIEYEKDLPVWAKSVDGQQVGTNKKGIALAYDYGTN